MSTENNRKLLATVFDQLAAGNARALTDVMADECRWIFPGDWSWGGVWEPKTEVVHKLLRPLMAQFSDDYRSEADMILAAEDRVVVQARGHATTKHGDTYEQTYCFIFRLADDRIIEVVEYCNSALVEKVLELPTR
ncbi:nuclear transport factor 2 family protein [Amycolatopsis sp. QT-25]|uniref:nuclear transport factor 2 family protein n=1 Tax=Amycolatopsis sp. QT-25 TaxID=3034022 RepID=UPI0023EB2211|nr:nuclear transport factor 2 family protein [Amycolatopsis sp. QT-25]WET82488.1 nuclear transport factor 2 family protein [Amycolatopsis sp. QT-25]